MRHTNSECQHRSQLEAVYLHTIMNALFLIDLEAERIVNHMYILSLYHVPAI